MMTLPTEGQSTAATELRRLALQPRLTRIATQLRSLADALDPAKQKDVHNWAGVDLFSAFLHEDAVGRPRSAWFGRALDIWVQALFFVPILITWLGLMEATRAYRQTLKVKAYATESFLAGWQSGFHGHLPGAFFLDQVAFDVVLSIAVLVASMVVQFVYRSRVDDDEPAKLYQDLARWLTAAQLELAPIRLSSPSHIAAELHNATAEIAKTAAAIREVGQIAERTQAEASNGLTTATAALSEVNQLATKVQTAAVNVGQASQAIEKRLGEIKSTTSAIVDAETSFVERLGQHSTNLSASANGLSTSIRDAMKSNSQEMAAAVTGSSAKIASSLDGGADQIRSGLAEIAVAGAQYTHQVEQAADVLGLAGDTVNKLPGIVAEFQLRVTETVAELQRRVVDVGDRIENLGQAIGRAKEAMPSAADIPADLRTTLGELSAAAAALQSASLAFQSAPPQSWPPSVPPRRFFRRGATS